MNVSAVLAGMLLAYSGGDPMLSAGLLTLGSGSAGIMAADCCCCSCVCCAVSTALNSMVTVLNRWSLL